MLQAAVASQSGFRLLSLLLFFIFGGAIVGETAAVSIVVSVSGLATLSRLYVINGLLLLGLPILFFRNIDRFKRERLLAAQLLGSAALLFAYLLVYSLRAGIEAELAETLLMVIYPLSYLSKTINFLTFWTLANDICDSGEAKKQFPVIAAWGFIGGLLGSLVAWALLQVVQAEAIIWLWAFLYLVGWVLVKKIKHQFWDRLLRTETVHLQHERLRDMVGDVLTIRLVRVMAVIYFLVFIGVFSLDYLFWKQCHRWFPTSNSLASFQYSFYLMHALVTIGALWLVLPQLISRWGFVKILHSLPVVLLVGSGVLLVARSMHVDVRMLFAGTIVLQFLRYVVFENAFSPIYQMFFVAIPTAKRGRAKTLLEGIVKPGALLLAGVYLTYFGMMERMVLGLITVASAALIYLVFAVRKTYIEELVPRLTSRESAGNIVAQIGSTSDSKIVSLVEEYAASNDSDLRCLAVRIFAHQATRQSLVRLREMYDRDESRAVREVIARSVGDFYWYETRAFVERLLREESPRLRANVLYSLSEMNARWKWEFRDAARAMLFDSSLRVQIEAARFLWWSGDDSERQSIRALMASLLGSRNPNKRSAGIYLVGVLQPPDWELILTRNLTADAPSQVFAKSIETILRFASEETRLAALETVEQLPRERIAQTGRAAQDAGTAVVPALIRFLSKPRNQRMSFEVVHALRVIKHTAGNETVRFDIDHRTERNILRWVVRELRSVYLDAYVWYCYGRDSGHLLRESGVQLLDSALRERVFRVAEWSLDAMVLLDREGLITWGRRDLDMREYANRLDMIEILESLGSHRIGALTVPLLKFESWESLGKRGRYLLKSRKLEQSGGLGHFLHADNRWVCLCALYALHQTRRSGKLADDAIEALKRLTADGNQHLAAAAACIVEPDVETGVTVESFQLLETVLFLKQTPLFRDIPGEKLMPVAEICEQKEYAKGTVISREGDVSDHLYVVKSGAVRIVRELDDGRERILATIEPGDTYGEVGLFSQAQRSATAVAHTDCRLYEVQRSALKRLLLTVPEIAYNFLEIFSDKLRRSADPAVRVDVDSAGRKVTAT